MSIERRRGALLLTLLLTVLGSGCNHTAPPSGGCQIDGKSVDAGAAEGSNPCQTCQPTVSTSAYSAQIDGTACGADSFCVSGTCTVGCSIGDAFAAAGATNPGDVCQVCQPTTSAVAWSFAPNGTPCDTGKVCGGGQCEASCFIDGGLVAPNAIDPANPCAVCAPATSTTRWGAVADGTLCGLGTVCGGGQCEASCFIDGGLVAPGAVNPSNPCESCAPGSRVSAWSAGADGTACGTGQVCSGGQCASDCFIGGVLVSASVFNPLNPCQQCDPSLSTTAWSPIADGSSCGAGKVCGNTQCVASCFIDGGLVAAAAPDPSNACRACNPATSTTAWSNVADGTSCGAGEVCGVGTCTAGCFIDGGLVAPGGLDGANGCLACSPVATTGAWTPLADGTPCSACNVCQGATCGPTTVIAGAQEPWDIALAGGYLYLTDYGNGASTGTVSRALVDGGGYQLLASSFVSPKGVAVANGVVYFADYGGKVIDSLPVTGGTATSFASGLTAPTSVFAYDGLIYFADPAAYDVGFYGELVGLYPDGGDADVVTSGEAPVAVAVDASGVYWTDSQTNSVYRASLDGGAAVLLSTQGNSYGIATDTDHVYWTNGSGDVLELLKADAGVITLATGEEFPWGITSDGANVYFVDYNQGPGSVGAVRRVPVDGGATVTLASSPSALGVALDSQCVYWTSQGAGVGSVLRTDK